MANKKKNEIISASPYLVRQNGGKFKSQGEVQHFWKIVTGGIQQEHLRVVANEIVSVPTSKDD